MTVRICLSLLLVALHLPAAADEDRIYESIAGVNIGRVFLTPAARARLDTRRLQQPSSDSVAQSGAAARPARKRLPSAGYIISASGKARVWRNGDFVAADRQGSERMAFPGDVRVLRHVKPAKAVRDESGDEK